MENSLLSVIIPVYNVEKYLEQCINSVISQTYSNIEVILINDGSTDASGKICDYYAKIDKRVKVFHQDNQGVVKARNVGIRNSNGEYITFVDADDWIDEDMYEQMLKRGCGYDLISSGGTVEYPNVEQGTCRYDKFPDGNYSSNQELQFIWENLIYFNNSNEWSWSFTSIWNKIFKKRLIEPIYMKQNENIKIGEDMVFLYKSVLACKSICVMHKSFYHYRMRETSAVHSVNKYYLCNINWLYIELEKEFNKHIYRDVLIYQLEKLVRELIDRALNYYMGFRSASRKIIHKLTDIEDIKGKKVVIYGAGRVGKDYYLQLKQVDCEIVLWVDKNYQNCNEEIAVSDVTEIRSVDYDYIIIAVKRKELADSIKNQLNELDVLDTKILWEKPY